MTAMGTSLLSVPSRFSLEHGRYLYHYTKAQKAADLILPDMRLQMSPMDEVNDPRESKGWFPVVTYRNTTLPDGMAYEDLVIEFNRVLRDHTKILCFTRDDPTIPPNSPVDLYGWGYAHSRMWDQYADRHTGVCLIFDMDTVGDEIAHSVGDRGDLRYMGVSYHNYPPRESSAFQVEPDDIDRLGLDAALIAHRDAHHGTLYFYKAEDWRSENEWRWVLFSDHDDQYEYITIERSLSGVVFGVNCNPDDVRRIRWLLRHRSGMKYATLKYMNGHPIPVLLP
jgi:hypothetical protein